MGYDESNITFKGAGYIKIFDHERLKGRARVVYNLMSDEKWRTLQDLDDATGFPQASLSAQLRAFRRKDFGSHTVNRRRKVAQKGTHEYQLIVKKEDPRAPKQREVVKQYLEDKRLQLTAVLGTGFGKSKVTLDIINELKPTKILILVNSTDLKDYSWRDEFYKFGMGMIFERDVHIVTYQEAYKWTAKTRDLTGWFVIADEVDFAANVDEYSKFFYQFPYVRILGLTGFITDDKKAWFRKHLPVFYSYSISNAQEDKVLNKMNFNLVKFELSKEKNIRVEYNKAGFEGKASFMTSENAQYEFQQKKYIAQVIERDKIEKDMFSGLISSTEYEVKMRQVEYQIKRIVKLRNEVLLNSNTNPLIIERIKRLLPEDAKTIVFSVLTKQSEKICDFTYNGKNSDAYNKQNFSNFNSGKLKMMGVCDKINRGVNIHKLNTGIFETYYGSDTQANQRLGRLARLNPDETSEIYVLLPYYRHKVRNEAGNDTFELRPTQQVKWCKKMLDKTIIHSHKILDWTNDSTRSIN